MKVLKAGADVGKIVHKKICKWCGACLEFCREEGKVVYDTKSPTGKDSYVEVACPNCAGPVRADLV